MCNLDSCDQLCLKDAWKFENVDQVSLLSDKLKANKIWKMSSMSKSLRLCLKLMLEIKKKNYPELKLN